MPLTYVVAVGETWSSWDGVRSKNALYVNVCTVGS